LWKYLAFESFIVRIEHEAILKRVDVIYGVSETIIRCLPMNVMVVGGSRSVQNPWSKRRATGYIGFDGVSRCEKTHRNIMYDLLDLHPSYSVIG